MKQIPRRIRIDKMVPAELAIPRAVPESVPVEVCQICRGEGVVCEDHPDMAWFYGDGCCGGAGMPCRCESIKTIRRLGMKFRKKPVVIEAVKAGDILGMAGHNWPALPSWIREAYEKGSILFAGGHVLIKTLEGDMRAEDGDWVIQGVKGEIYPCKSDIFAATYEPADRSAPAVPVEVVEALESGAGLDCHNFHKHLSPKPCGECMPCLCRKALASLNQPVEKP